MTDEIRERVVLDGFIIEETDDLGKIWIIQDDGEGGQFCVKAFSKVVREFYDEHF